MHLNILDYICTFVKILSLNLTLTAPTNWARFQCFYRKVCGNIYYLINNIELQKLHANFLKQKADTVLLQEGNTSKGEILSHEFNW